MSASVHGEEPHPYRSGGGVSLRGTRQDTMEGQSPRGRGTESRQQRKPLACSPSRLFVQEAHVTCPRPSRVRSDRKAAETASRALKGSKPRKVSEIKSHVEKPPGGRSLGEPVGGKQSLLRLDAGKTPIYTLTPP